MLPPSRRGTKRPAAPAEGATNWIMQSGSQDGDLQADAQPGLLTASTPSVDNNECEQYHQTPGTASPYSSRAWPFHAAGDYINSSPERATEPQPETEACREEATEEVESEEEPITLKERAAIMFSGKTGAPVASGEDGVAEEPTLGLVKAIVSIVEDLPGNLFNANAAHRPCGVLDRYEAAGMLLGDVLGRRPLLPRGKDSVSQKLGKAMQKLPAEIPAKQAAAKKAAKRRGQDAEEAAAAVLREPVKLTALPPVEDGVPQPPPAPAPAPPPAPQAPAPAPASFPRVPPRPLHLRKQPPLSRKERRDRARIFSAWDNSACECA
eukprot:4690509-Prymnesium_polylepis.1